MASPPRRNSDPGVSSSLGGETPLDVGETEAPLAPVVQLSREDREMLEDARLSQLMANDPTAYEQEMMDVIQESENGSRAEGPD